MSHPRIDIAIIGVQKAATTSLHRYMGMHPDVLTHQQLEYSFFVMDEEYCEGYEATFSKYFKVSSDGHKVLIKNVGIIYWEDALKRLYEHNPQVRMIILLRNPVDRAYSAYQYARLMGFEKSPTFEIALEKDLSQIEDKIIRGTVDYKGRGRYAEQLEAVYSLFPKEQVKVILQDDLQSDPEKVLKDCFGFAGLDPGFVPDFKRKFNESGRARFPIVMRWMKRTRLLRRQISKVLPFGLGTRLRKGLEQINRVDHKSEPMLDETRKKLLDYYLPYNKRLQDLIQRDLYFWNVAK
ncbi:MAG: sulfotransferase domain-containing protein [Bacteroidota bacterium]|jgi:hypothetical protein